MEEFSVTLVAVQLSPVHKDPVASMTRATELLQTVTTADVMVLPEMAFPGYIFRSEEDIRPFLEQPNAQFPTFRWCQSEARRTHSYVVCGYPETAADGLFNSQMVVSPEGTLVGNYRKHNLYRMDKSWAQAGSEFSTLDISIRGRRVRLGLGICRDIKPYDDSAPAEVCELATHWKRTGADIMAFSTNWDSSNPDSTAEELIDYWISRLTPILDNPHKPAFFLAADRVGSEYDTTFMGGSCLIQNSPAAVLVRLDKTREGVLQRSVVLGRET